MNKVEKLIARLCPDGTRSKSIGEICQINRGRVMSKDYLRNNAGKYPVYSSQTANDGVFGRINTYDYDGEYLTWTTDGANAGSIFYRNGKFSITNVCGLLKVKVSDVNTKFLSYILTTVSKRHVSTGMGNPKIMSNVMERILIPIPPLAIQEEIVNILDSFTKLETKLETELEAELEGRKKQYDFYRNKLFSFDGERAKWVELGEIGTIIRGNGLQKKDFVEDGVGCIHYGQIYTYYGTFTHKTKSFVSPNLANRLKKVKKGDLVVASTSENIEDVCKAVAWLGEDEIVTGGHATIFRHHENPKYLSYFFQTSCFSEQKRKYARGTKVIDLSAKDLAKIKIPIPPLSEQERIVAVLDKFETLVNDISVSLFAELNARRKQYEYYRDRLLTFSPLKKEYAK